ncbi:hypothetical protein GQ457_15G019640 [Hibiscus cannabinus]
MIVWEVIRHKQPKVQWHRTVLGALSIPKQSFITWLVVLNRLPTKDRMLKWGCQVEATCILCGIELESRDHLFWACSYSRRVWGMVVQACGVQLLHNSWDDLLGWIQRAGKGKTLKATIVRLAWNSFNYYVWMERNGRLHQKEPKLDAEVFDLIKHDFKWRLLGCRRCSFPGSCIAEAWGLQ